MGRERTREDLEEDLQEDLEEDLQPSSTNEESRISNAESATSNTVINTPYLLVFISYRLVTNNVLIFKFSKYATVILMFNCYCYCDIKKAKICINANWRR